MRLLVSVWIALLAQAPTKPPEQAGWVFLKPDCGQPFSLQPETFVDLGQHPPASVFPGVLKGVYAYAGKIVQARPMTNSFDVVVFDSKSDAQRRFVWSVPETKSKPAADFV